MDWQLAEAKNRFSDVVTKALNEGPQRVRRRDQAVIILSEQAYQRLVGQRPDFKSYLLEGPSLEGLELSRDQTSARDISL